VDTTAREAFQHGYNQIQFPNALLHNFVILNNDNTKLLLSGTAIVYKNGVLWYNISDE
jgi:hypothetical protein